MSVNILFYDMIDFVLNNGLAKLGSKYGFDKICCLSLIDADNAIDFRKKLSKADGLTAARANENFSREIFESNKVNLVFGLENAKEKDNLHYKKSGLDNVLCGLANKNRISIGFSFYEVLHAKDKGRLIGRMIQNVKLCKKYNVNMVVASFAKDRYDLRLRNDLEAFGRLIGIDKFDNTKVFKLKENSDIKVIG